LPGKNGLSSSFLSLCLSSSIRTRARFFDNDSQWAGMAALKVASSIPGNGGCPAAYMACVTTFPSRSLPMWHE